MKTINPLPLTTFSQVDYPIELENMFDYSGNQEFTKLTDTTATITNTSISPLPNINIGEELWISVAINIGSGLELYEIKVQATTASTSGSTFEVLLIDSVFAAFPDGVFSVAFYKVGDTTPQDVTFGLVPNDGDLVEFKIRANSEGKGKVFIGEILRTYLPEFLAPKDYETNFINSNNISIKILFNGAEENEILVVNGSKFLTIDSFYNTNVPINPLGGRITFFKEQLIGYYTAGEDASYIFKKTFVEGLPIGNTQTAFNIYPAIPCRKKIYLSANYGLLPDGDLIDVSVPVLAFINRAGQYEYIRFTGSNVNKYNVQEARLKQDYAGTITNADTGLIYEGIELTLADDGENTDFPYIIDKLELQRCRALLMESPKAWLLVNGELQQCLEVRVKRESVRFATSFDKSRDNFTAQCEVIVCQPLGNPQY